MKKTGPAIALITPDGEGWALQVDGHALESGKTMAELGPRLPAGAVVHVALPGPMVVMERLALPAIDSDELAGMVQLQLEKTLPYPLEEAASAFVVLSQTETESVVLSMAAKCSQLEVLCGVLSNDGSWPQYVSFYPQQVAANCEAGQVVLCLWREQGQVAVALVENGKLAFSEHLNGLEEIEGRLPQLLLGAEMNGVSTNFSRIWLDPALAEGRQVLESLYGLTPQTSAMAVPVISTEINLAPASWKARRVQEHKQNRLRQRLQSVAIVYLLAIAAVFIYLAWVKSRVQKLDVQLAQAQPLIDFVQAQQSQWNAMAPAVDPARYTIEVLYQVFASLPSGDVKITTFEHDPAQFRVEGEAPSAHLAIEFVEKLRAEKALSDYRIESPPPSILPSGAAHYNIFGRL